MAKIVIGTPASRPPEWSYVKSLWGLDIANHKVTFKHQPGYGGVDSACSDLARFALEDGADWFLLVASDAVLHHDTLLRLLSWDVPAVAALSFTRYAPMSPTVYPFANDDPDDGQLFAIEYQGIIEWIKRHPQLLKINAPAVISPRPDDALLPVVRFGTHVSLFHCDALATTAPRFFERQGPRGSGEDFNFVGKIVNAGFQPCVDLSVIAGHVWGDWSIGALDFMVWAQSTNWERGELIIGVTKEGENVEEIQGAEKVLPSNSMRGC
jgi:hypothetical protein